ncbi:unnamed protein product [Ixodes persulcatus]
MPRPLVHVGGPSERFLRGSRPRNGTRRLKTPRPSPTNFEKENDRGGV